MKYSCEVIIDAPREEVIKKLDNPENMKHWQRGLINYELTSGTAGQPGATMSLEYQMGKRHLKMVETIVKNNFPSEFQANYDAKGVKNMQHNYFEEMHDGTTKWRSDAEFKFDSFGLKFISWIMPGAFKKQSMIYLTDFKAFVEEGKSVTEDAKS